MDIQKIAEGILWDGVSDYIESVEEFKKMIIDISYIDHSIAANVDWCETFETEGKNILEYNISEHGTSIRFEMFFVLSAWNSEEQLFRVTASINGKAILRSDELVEIDNVIYDNVEVDSVYL